MAHNARRTCGTIQRAVRKTYYASQRQKTELNRLNKRRKHMKRQPNDLQTAKSL